MTEARILTDVRIPTRDGVALAADVHLAKTQEPNPVVLAPSPYGRRRPFLLKMARALAARGFTTVLVDFRGRGDSGGQFHLADSNTDGRDILLWLREQCWCSGRVGLFGISLSSFAAFQTASDPPVGIEIGAFVNLMGQLDGYGNCYRNGALVHHWALPWCVMMAEENRRARDWQALPWKELFECVPLEKVRTLAGGLSPFWEQTLRTPFREGFWDALDARPLLSRIAVPTLHLTGWFDFMAHQVIAAYSGMTRRPIDEGPPQRLLIGPWDHETIFLSFLYGRMDVTRLGTEAPLNLLGIVAGWFERHLLSRSARSAAADAFDREPSVLAYLLGAQHWVGMNRFPPESVTVEDWYLSSDFGAATAGGDGRLARTVPARPGWDTYVYDPKRPVPTRGGAVWPFMPSGLRPGPADQAAIEQRLDVLVYTGDTLPEELYVVGSIHVDLWAATSATETDFTAKLVDVAPDGTPRIVQDGIVRSRFRHNEGDHEPIECDRPYCYSFDLGTTAHCFRSGHRVRLEVSSSNFPKYDRNLNVAAPVTGLDEGIPAHQTIHYGGDRTSRLRLPVVARSTVMASRWTPPTAWSASP